jgi:uncharacterized protein (TIGR03382 family)
MDCARHRTAFCGVLLTAALAAAGAALASPQIARACTFPAPEPKFEGVPAEGDVGVPTDVVPYYQFSGGIAPSGSVEGTFTLRAADGTSIDLTARVADRWNYELKPSQPLAPQTAYVLHGEWPSPNGPSPTISMDDVHFMTGNGVLAAPPPTPVGRLVNYSLDPKALSSCSPQPFGTCISVQDDKAMIVVTYFDALNQPQGAYGYRGSFFGADLRNICVQVRTRALNAALSDPLLLCGAMSSLQEIHGTDQIHCTAAGILPMTPPPEPEAPPVPVQAPQDAGLVQVADPTPAADAGVAAAPSDTPQLAAPAAAAANPTPAASVGSGQDNEPSGISTGSAGCSASPAAPKAGSVLAPFALLAFGLLARRRRALRP